MDELRLKKIEKRLDHHENLLDSHGNLHAAADKRMNATDDLVAIMKKTTDSHEEMVNIAREVIDLLKQLIKYLSWVGVAAKWISCVAVAFTAAWHAAKWVIANIWFFR